MAKDVLEAKIDQLARGISKGFASIDKKFEAMTEDMTELRSDVSEVKHATVKLQASTDETNDRFITLEHELRSISKELTLLEEAVCGMRGFSKEIDELRVRIKAIELEIRSKR